MKRGYSLVLKFPYIRWLLLIILSIALSIGFSGLSKHLFVAQAQTPDLSEPAVTGNLVQSARTLYHSQRYGDARQQLRQAAQIYSTTGDSVLQAQALALESLALQKLGHWTEAQSALTQSTTLLVTHDGFPARIQAQIFNAQGSLYLATGRAQAAISSWEQAEHHYAAIGEAAGVIGSQINQVQALESLGFYYRAGQLLTTIESQLEQIPDSAIKVKGLLKLGNMLRRQGELQRSRERLTTGLSLAQSLDLSSLLSQLYLSLGTTEHIIAARAQALNRPDDKPFQAALNYYQQAAIAAPSILHRTEAQLSELRLLTQPSLASQLDSSDRIQSLIANIEQALPQLPSGRRSIYAQINFAHRLMGLTKDVQGAISPTLDQAIADATVLHDKRAISYATGTLGTWHEINQDWELAKDLTRTALQTAQAIQASDITYQWQWQLGRIIQAEADQIIVNSGQINQLTRKPEAKQSKGVDNRDRTPAQPAALQYYSAAVKTLNDLRSDLVALNPDIQFSFRDQVEPVYRELVGLLLREETPAQEQLRQARDIIESLQLAELDNFFRDACAKPQATNIDTVDPNAAIVYPILLQDRLEVILQLPSATVAGQPQEVATLMHASQPIVERDVTQAAIDLQTGLERLSTPTRQIKAQSQQLYNWMIRPFESALDVTNDRDNSSIKTLAFVLDGPLRNVPMAVLHDGKQYLVERYAIAITPGLQLLEPKPLKRQALNILLGGAENAPSFAAIGLGPLDNVGRELNGIKATIPTSRTLIDHVFLKDNIQQDLETTPFNVVHLATHGKFSSDPEQTFVLDWEQKISAQDIDSLLRISNPHRAVKNPIELLVLSACETASGDSRAALGLAGIAIRAGARSTLATLWQVNDASTTEFMVRFYKELINPDITKADALRNVQLSFLNDNPRTRHNRPNRWAPFMLVGNWL